MTWQSFHRRGEILRTVIATADDRLDGRLPMEVDGVAQTFEDELALLGALQLRWHTRLAGRIERELMQQPLDLESAVVAAWHATADEMPGIRAVLDRQRIEPTNDDVAEALATATSKEHVLLAVMAGQSSPHDGDAAARVGARIEERARAGWRLVRPESRRTDNPGLIGRIKAALAA